MTGKNLTYQVTYNNMTYKMCKNLAKSKFSQGCDLIGLYPIDILKKSSFYAFENNGDII